MPRGGRRNGKPGQAYSNRTDMNTSKIAEYTGQQYGKATAQRDAQRAMPVQAPPGPPAPQTPPAAQAPGPAPGSLGELLGPTARPDEPLTHGAPFGPGPGPAAPATNPDQAAVDRLRLLYRQTGLPSLGRLLEAVDE
jgi:hypothetical protein